IEIQARRATAPYEHIHDGAIQTEQAINFLLARKNPYVENYIQTPMAQWHKYFGLAPRDNPALFYLPYLPLTFIAPLPFFPAFQAALGFFDLRMYQLIVFVGLFFLLFQLTQEWDRKLALAILVALNPLFVPTFIEGRNDVVVLWWLVLALYFLQRRRIALASIALGLACVVKATAWFAVPFFLAHLWLTGFRQPRAWMTRVLLPLLSVGMIFVAPFLVWDARAFIDGALWYQSSAYRIAGQGFSRWVLELGLVANEAAAFPFTFFQVMIGAPVLIVLTRWQTARPTLQRMVAAMAVFGFVIGYFGRAFADNHMGFVLSLALLALGIGEERS
ncbi:MAG: glycosyltransferase 87 family protein, partial [Anaerolineales bacterium]|nr:glycosyltransferase 87 family protein [Anaerolineales bacterium]